jgi:hypothetical protein
MRTHYLIASIACFLGIMLILWGSGCAPEIKLIKPVSSVITIEMVDGLITDCGVPYAIGCARKYDSYYSIMISREAPDQESTLIHEMRHVGRWMVGWEGSWLGH